MRQKVFFMALFAVTMSAVYSQQLSYFDGAQAYNKLLIEKNNGSYTRVGNYKVIGSPFFYGEKHSAKLYTKGGTVHDVKLSYNTYQQEVEFYSSSNTNTAFVKEAGLIDSFEIKENKNLSIPKNLKFIYGPLLGSKDKNYYQVVSSGKNYDLYKKYQSQLGIVTTNYIQSELRQFDLSCEYYYAGKGEKSLKKLKPTRTIILKEFKHIKNLSSQLDVNSFAGNTESTLKKIFIVLNQ